MAWNPPKSVAVTSLGAGYGLCSGCPGYMIALDQIDTHTAWHATYGDDLAHTYGVTDLLALPTGQGQVTLTWKNPSPLPAMITATRTGTDPTTGQPLSYTVILPGNVTQTVFGSLDDGTTYTFTVSPNGGQVSSAQCTTPTMTPMGPPAPSTDAPDTTTTSTTSTDSGSSDTGQNVGGAQARNNSGSP